MNYKRAVAYIPGVSVLFELDNGSFALVSIGDKNAKFLITVSAFAESFLKFGGFCDGRNIPKELLDEAGEILRRGEAVFESRDLKFKNQGESERSVNKFGKIL